MDKSFKYDMITVYHENGVPYGKPTWSISQKLDQVIANSEEQMNYLRFEEWANDQKYPILTTIEIKDGTYSAELFKLFVDPLKGFGKDLSHYQYLKIEQQSPVEKGSSFDETVSLPPAQETNKPDEHLSDLFKTKYNQLEKFMCHLLIADALGEQKTMMVNTGTTALKKAKRQAN